MCLGRRLSGTTAARSSTRGNHQQFPCLRVVRRKPSAELWIPCIPAVRGSHQQIPCFPAVRRSHQQIPCFPLQITLQPITEPSVKCLSSFAYSWRKKIICLCIVNNDILNYLESLCSLSLSLLFFIKIFIRKLIKSIEQ